MTPAAEARVREAVDALAAALLSAIAEQARPVAAGPERLLSIPEAADALGIGRTALYGMIGRGELRSVSVGRRRLVAPDAIRELAARSDGATT